ncbi:MAG: hypothetical protein JWO38_6524 [Gemmataceae bacterium]|nr:hypothetical protein [Gemmataceae bacterium]
MTEAEWLAGADWRPMWLTVRDRLSERKMRLFGVGYCGLLRQESFFQNYLYYEPWAEQVADARLTLDEARADARARLLSPVDGENAFEYLLVDDPGRRWGVTRLLAFYCTPNADLRVPDLLRCIAGYPFRSVTPDPDWQTSTAITLAQQMYESRDFSPMPILADALQDAGCDHPDVLAHCRGAGPHVRGCWVVDLLLGKE